MSEDYWAGLPLSGACRPVTEHHVTSFNIHVVSDDAPPRGDRLSYALTPSEGTGQAPYLLSSVVGLCRDGRGPGSEVWGKPLGAGPSPREPWLRGQSCLGPWEVLPLMEG